MRRLLFVVPVRVMAVLAFALAGLVVCGRVEFPEARAATPATAVANRENK